MMAQKINAVGFRLKKRIDTAHRFCAHNFNDYSNISATIQQYDVVTNALLQQFHVYTNDALIQKSGKLFTLYSKLIHKTKFINKSNESLDFLTSERYRSIKKDKQNINKLVLNKQQVNYYFSDFFFSKNSKYFSLFCQNRQVLLFPKFIVAYITNQLNKSGTLKRISFRKNLNLGILTFSFKLLKHLQNTVNGLKIICSGK